MKIRFVCPLKGGDGHTFRSFHAFTNNCKILLISEQEPTARLAARIRTIRYAGEGEDSRIAKITGLSFAGFVAASIVADKVNPNPFASQIAGFTGAVRPARNRSGPEHAEYR